MWKEALWYNGLRTVGTGLVLAVLGLFMAGQNMRPIMGVFAARLMYMNVLLPLTLIVVAFIEWFKLGGFDADYRCVQQVISLVLRLRKAYHL